MDSVRSHQPLNVILLFQKAGCPAQALLCDGVCSDQAQVPAGNFGRCSSVFGSTFAMDLQEETPKKPKAEMNPKH